MIIDFDMTVTDLISQVKDGKKHFSRIDFGEGNISDCDLEGVVFEECLMLVEFSNVNLRHSRFIGCGIKTCVFDNVDLTNAEIMNCSVESVVFRDSNLEGLVFENNFSYGATLHQCDLEMLVE